MKTNNAWLKLILQVLVCFLSNYDWLGARTVPLLCLGYSILPTHDRSLRTFIVPSYDCLSFSTKKSSCCSLQMIKSPSAEFEYQEMKVLLGAMQKDQIVSAKQMDTAKSQELNRYIERVIRASANDQRSLSTEELHNSTWTLAYTTMEALPPDSTIQMIFREEDHAANSLQYRLIFGPKTVGLNAINVLGEWTLRQNTVFMTYEKLSMDAFGLENVHLCLLQNLLKGRTNRIDTVYYDGNVWIEESISVDNQYSTPNRFWNVYIKDTEDKSYR